MSHTAFLHRKNIGFRPGAAASAAKGRENYLAAKNRATH
jgi:hypothetical protein